MITTLRDGWWTLDVPPEIDLDQPGIYEWKLGNKSVYIGKSKRLRSRIREYPNNVRKLLDGAPYRKGKATAFRAIHHGLRSAHDALVPVMVSVLENCEVIDLNRREQHWIIVRRAQAEQGGPRVLNGT